ncbi:MAG: 50S ribosomal protein L10 [Actinomycetota bacterium]
MPTEEKVKKVEELSERLSSAVAALFANYRGLTVPEMNELRAVLSEVNASFSVVKNRLTKLAIEKAGLEGLEQFLQDTPTAIAFVGGDPAAGAKVLVEATKKYPVLEVKGGFAEGRVLDASDVLTLASLDSREAMLAKVAGLAKAKTTKTAWLLQALVRQFASLLDARRTQLGEDRPAPEEQQESEQTPEEPTPQEPSESEGGT